MQDTRQRGMTLVTVTVGLVAIMAIAALALDIGVAYTAHTSAQHAADAAALAGAFSLNDPSKPQPSTAQNDAIATAAKNTVLGNPVVITAANVTVNTAAVPPYVTVTVPVTGLRTYFAAALKITQMGVTAQATAEAWKGGYADMCLKPFFIPDTIFSKLQIGTNTTLGTACGSNPKQVIFSQNADGTYSYSPWAIANNIMPMSASSPPISIHPGDPSGALTPSQFYEINLAADAPGGGAALYNCTLGHCLNECPGALTSAACGSSYPVLTGAKVGPTNQGIDTLIGQPPTDTYLGPGQYNTPNGIMDTSRALAIAPIWDDCNQTISPGYNGQSVKIVGFVKLFFDHRVGTNTYVRFIEPITCATAGITGPGGAPLTGPFGQPIHLVQNPAP